MATNTNILVIEGRLTRDPVVTKIQSGTTLCKFSIANNRYYYTDKGFKNEVSFFDVVVWGNLADKSSTRLKKGNPILINGQLRQDTYMSKTGTRKQSIYILASEIQFLDKKAENTYNTNSNTNTYDNANNINTHNSHNTFNAYSVNDIGEDVASKTTDYIEEALTVSF